MLEDIKRAIQERRTVEISYGGESRLIAPYTYGMTSNNKEALRCFQFQGGSASGNQEGWKLLIIEKIESVNVLEDEFEIHEQYRMNDKVMREIYAQVEL